MFSKIKYYHFPDQVSNKTVDYSINPDTKVIFVILKKDTNEQITNMLKNLLEKGLSLESKYYQILSINMEPRALGSLIKTKDQKLVISFGIALNQLGFKTDAEPYFLYNLSGTYLMQVDSAQSMETNKNLKAKLWNGIKHLKEEL